MLGSIWSPTNDKCVYRSREPAYEQSPLQSNQPSWTAARCLRLLRPLTSKLALLGKLRAADDGHGVDGHDREDGEEIGDQRCCGRELPLKSTVYQDEASDQWVSNPRPRKKIKCTYSARARATGSKRPVSNEIWGSKNEGPTLSPTEDPTTAPTMSQNASQDEQSSFGDATSCYEAVMKAAKVDFAPNLPFRPDGSQQHRHFYPNVTKQPGDSRDRGKLERGITESLLALLKATECPTQQHKHGSPSLFRTCLASVPEWIFNEEAYQAQDEDDKDYDAAAEIFRELEEISISGSWKPLRTVVRSHGIKILYRALCDGVLSSNMGTKLISLCIIQGALHEARKLMCSMISIFKQEKPTQNSHSTTSKTEQYIMEGLYLFLEHDISLGFIYVQLTDLMESDVPQDTCWPLVQPFLGYAIKSAIRGEDVEDAYKLLRIVMRASYGGDSQAVASRLSQTRRELHCSTKRQALRSKHAQREVWQTTKSPLAESFNPSSALSEVNATSILAMLASLGKRQGFTTSLSGHESSEPGALALMEGVAIDALQNMEISVESPDQVASNTKTDVISILFASATSIIGLRSDDTPGSYLILSRLAHSGLSEAHWSQFGQHMALVARLEGIVSQREAFYSIQTMVDHLRTLSMAPECESTSRLFLRRVIVKAASAFAFDATKLAHLEWALGVEEEFFGKDASSAEQNAHRTPAKTTPKPKPAFRWEEDICAWIVKTPAEQIRLPKKQSLESVTDLDELVDATLGGSPILNPRPQKRCTASKTTSQIVSPRKGETVRMRAILSERTVNSPVPRSHPRTCCVTSNNAIQVKSPKPKEPPKAMQCQKDVSQQRTVLSKVSQGTAKKRPLECSKLVSADIEMADELGEELEVYPRRVFGKPKPLRERRAARNQSVTRRMVYRKFSAAASVGIQKTTKGTLHDLVDLDSDGVDELSF